MPAATKTQSFMIPPPAWPCVVRSGIYKIYYIYNMWAEDRRRREAHLPRSICSLSGLSWTSSSSSLWWVSDTCRQRGQRIEWRSSSDTHLVIISSQTENPTHEPREEIPKPFRRWRVSKMREPCGPWLTLTTPAHLLSLVRDMQQILSTMAIPTRAVVLLYKCVRSVTSLGFVFTCRRELLKVCGLTWQVSGTGSGAGRGHKLGSRPCWPAACRRRWGGGGRWRGRGASWPGRGGWPRPCRWGRTSGWWGWTSRQGRTPLCPGRSCCFWLLCCQSAATPCCRCNSWGIPPSPGCRRAPDVSAPHVMSSCQTWGCRCDSRVAKVCQTLR